MSEASLEERSYEPRCTPRELQAVSITGRGHRYRPAPVPAPSKNEILQCMFSLQAEGLSDEANVTLLERFLGVDVNVDVALLDRLLEEGYVERVGDRYKLSEAGAREGGLEFAASFEELMKPTHGECSPDCWCHNSPDEAEACARDRAMHAQEHDH